MEEIIREVMEGFKIGLNSYSKSKAAYLLDTDIGALIMRRQADGRKTETAFAATELLHEAGYKHAERYLTICGRPYFAAKDGIYTVSQYDGGSKCSLTDTASVLSVATAVAELQNAPVKPQSSIGISRYAAPAYYAKRTLEARHIKKWLDGRSRLTDIDVLFIIKYGEYMKIAADASRRIFAFAGDTAPRLCHGEIKEDNLFINSDNKVTLLNFENCSLSPPHTDLCMLLRRYVKRGGSVSQLPEIIAAYGDVRKLSADDIEYIKAFLSFPHKFFALINRYYNSKRVFDNSYIYTKLKSEIALHDNILGILNNI